MVTKRSLPHRRPKAKRPCKLVVYLSDQENYLVQRAAAISGRSRSAFGADVIVSEAKRILGLPLKS